MKRDENLEIISDIIRHGIPVDFCDAIKAIDYQNALKVEKLAKRNKRLVFRFFNWVKDFWSKL